MIIPRERPLALFPGLSNGGRNHSIVRRSGQAANRLLL